MIRKNSIALMAVVGLLCACQKEDLRPHLKSKTKVQAPIQSDSCLLGEKIMGYEFIIDSLGDSIEVPIWREDNFNVHDSLHKNMIPILYRHYDIQWWNSKYVIIQTKKLYYKARTFTRIIQFDEDGFQMNDTTFYNLRLGTLEEHKNHFFLVLDDPVVSTEAHDLSEKYGYSSTIVILNSDLTEKKYTRLKRNGMSTYFRSYETLENGVAISFDVEEMCGLCYDKWWSYTLYYDDDFNVDSINVSDTSKIRLQEHEYREWKRSMVE